MVPCQVEATETKVQTQTQTEQKENRRREYLVGGCGMSPGHPQPPHRPGGKVWVRDSAFSFLFSKDTWAPGLLARVASGFSPKENWLAVRQSPRKRASPRVPTQFGGPCLARLCCPYKASGGEQWVG